MGTVFLKKMSATTSSYIHNNFVSDFCRFDCGMFMVKYIDFYSRGLDLCFTQVNSRKILNLPLSLVGECHFERRKTAYN